MPAATNLFQDLKTALSQFKDFLNNNKNQVKPAVQPLDQLTGGRITDLVNKLIDLMGKLKTEIDTLANNPVPGLAQVTAFAQGITSFLQAVKTLLPDEASTVDEISGVVSVVTSLPSVQDVKAELDSLIDAIVADLNFLIH